MKRLRNLNARRLAPWIFSIVVVIVAAGMLVSTSQSSVTRPRLERSLPQIFSNLYVQQAALLGHKNVTLDSLQAHAQCDKAGPKVPDRGPGADWICYMSWHDPNVDQTLMPGKFEVNAHSNNCYTAGGPSKLVGLLTITDKRGKDVPNPVFEFDGCFDPDGSNAPTGVNLEPTKNSPTGPAVFAIASRAVHPDAHGVVRLAVTCADGQEGCGGTIAATLAGASLAPITYALAPGSGGSILIALDRLQAQAGGRLGLTVKPVIGDAASARFTLPVIRT